MLPLLIMLPDFCAIIIVRHMLHPQHRRAQNGVDDPIEVLDGDRLYPVVGDRSSSIVEEAIHPSPLWDTCVDHAYDIGFLRNVSLDEVAPIGPQRVRKGLAKLCAAAADNNFCALGDEVLGSASPHSTRCSGDDCYLSI